MTLISEEYREQQTHLHESNPNYGSASLQWGKTVADMAKSWGCEALLDYGAGKQRLKPGLDEAGYSGMYFPYDPAIEKISKIGDLEYDLVVCIDVLEHIEPNFLEYVLDDLQKHTHYRGFCTVHTGPAKKFLMDGRNAHLTQEPARWWLPKLCQRWNILALQSQKSGFQVVVEAL